MIANGIIGPFGKILLGVVYLLITIYSIYLVIKNEKSYRVLLWVIFILFFPVIGGLIYIFKRLIIKV